MVPSPETVAIFSQALGDSTERVFPFRLEAVIPFDGEEERRTMVVGGFQYRQGEEIVEFR